MTQDKGDFSVGNIWAAMIRLALPILLAEFVHVLYNIVDRAFIARIPEIGTVALSGVGIVFPLISFIGAFASLCSTGGSPLCSIRRGEGDEEEARKILETSFTMLLVIGGVLMVILLPTMKWTLRWMGADDTTYVYAHDYFQIYLYGTIFTLISLGMNSFINLQGNVVVGMLTVMIGAALNIILDPVLIFGFNMGVKGAAIATVISQAASAGWVIIFLFSKRAQLRIKTLRIDTKELKRIISLGISGFMFKMTNSITQAVANITLGIFGGINGSLYIGSMSVINSMREVVSLPLSALTSGYQPIVSYNYGAKKYSRIVKAAKACLVMVLSYSILAWALVMLKPDMFLRILTPDENLITLAIPCMRLYFGAFFMMSFQNVGQNTFVSMNFPKKAVFFSLFRKVILVVPLTLILPRLGFGAYGVFLAEMISQIIGGTCCFTTMAITVLRKVKKTKDGDKITFK